MTAGWLSRNPPKWMIRKTGWGWTVFKRKPIHIGFHYISEAIEPTWAGAMTYIERVST